MFTPINGWTKEMMIETIYGRNNGHKCKTYNTPAELCLYKLEENHCAIGCFIPDHLINNENRYWGIAKLLDYNPDLELTLPLNLAQLNTLQGIHDEYPGDGDVRAALVHWIEENVK